MVASNCPAGDQNVDQTRNQGNRMPINPHDPAYPVNTANEANAGSYDADPGMTIAQAAILAALTGIMHSKNFGVCMRRIPGTDSYAERMECDDYDLTQVLTIAANHAIEAMNQLETRRETDE